MIRFKITRVIEIEPITDASLEEITLACQNSDQQDLDTLHEFEDIHGNVIEFSIDNIITKVEIIK